MTSIIINVEGKKRFVRLFSYACTPCLDEGVVVVLYQLACHDFLADTLALILSQEISRDLKDK